MWGTVLKAFAYLRCQLPLSSQEAISACVWWSGWKSHLHIYNHPPPLPLCHTQTRTHTDLKNLDTAFFISVIYLRLIHTHMQTTPVNAFVCITSSSRFVSVVIVTESNCGEVFHYLALVIVCLDIESEKAALLYSCHWLKSNQLLFFVNSMLLWVIVLNTQMTKWLNVNVNMSGSKIPLLVNEAFYASDVMLGIISPGIHFGFWLLLQKVKSNSSSVGHLSHPGNGNNYWIHDKTGLTVLEHKKGEWGKWRETWKMSDTACDSARIRHSLCLKRASQDEGEARESVLTPKPFKFGGVGVSTTRTEVL